VTAFQQAAEHRDGFAVALANQDICRAKARHLITAIQHLQQRPLPTLIVKEIQCRGSGCLHTWLTRASKQVGQWRHRAAIAELPQRLGRKRRDVGIGI
jgi:hypothetical protein